MTHFLVVGQIFAANLLHITAHFSEVSLKYLRMIQQ